MSLRILTDENVRTLLHGLDHDEVTSLAYSLGSALHEFSTGDTNAGCCADFQPTRTVVKKNNITSLFMPATSNSAVGMKVVSLSTPEVGSSNASVISKDSSTGSDLHQSGRAMSNVADASSDRASSISAESFQPPASIASSQSTAPKGLVSIMSPTGVPLGILNAEELTAFRTALSPAFMITRRKEVHTVTVFGAGKIAYWHVRLALILRGKDIHRVNIINRSFDSAINLMKKFQAGESGKQEWSHVKFSAMSPEFGEYGRLLKQHVREADVIFCCTPSTSPLFPHEFLTSTNGRKKGRYISAIGSYAPHMIELHPEIIKVAVQREHAHTHHISHKHARQEGVIIVDTLEGALHEAGEIIQAKLTPEQLVEYGELVMVKRSVQKEMEAGGAGEKGLIEWLSRGNVIYKSVGLGLMDLTVGSELIRLANEKDIGTRIADF